MDIFTGGFQRNPGLWLMLGAMAMIYAASRAAVDAIVPDGAGFPGRRAVGHWIPIALTAGLAVLLGYPQIAVDVTFATAVAALALVGGIVAFVGPGARAEPYEQRIWPMLLPVTLLALLAGFRGELTGLHAWVFLIEGAVVLSIWLGASAMPQANVPMSEVREKNVTPAIMKLAQMILAIAIAAAGAWLAIRAVRVISQQSRSFSIATLASTLLGPMLVLPMIGTGSAMAQRGQARAALTTGVGVVCLNLCLLLPGLIVLQGGTTQLAMLMTAPRNEKLPPVTTAPATMSTTHPTTAASVVSNDTPAANSASDKRLPYPLAIWRIDAVLLLVLAMVYLPVALGRWSPGRLEGIGLIVVYAIYLMSVAGFGARWS